MHADPKPSDPTPPATVPEQPQAQPGPSSDTPAYTRRRTGFVALKPKLVRDKIGFMLLDGVPYRQITINLGEDGKDLNEDHIRSWANGGGHEEWVLDLHRNEAIRSTREGALDVLKEKAGTPVQDAARTVAATQLYELLLSFDATTFAAALADKPELYLRLVNAISRLSEGEAVCGHRRAQESLIAAKLQPAEATTEKKLLTTEELKDLARQIKLL